MFSKRPLRSARVLSGLIIFAIAYVLIAGRRLQWLPIDRPAGALLGAVLMVACGVLSPAAALAAINGETLLLLFGLMGIGAALAADGFLDRAAAWLAWKAGTPKRLLGALIWGAGLLSACITNDAVCVIGAPLVVAWVQRHHLPPLPFLIALATSANTGSVATLVGNPQNMLCGSLGDLNYATYLLHLGPVAIVSLAVNHGLVLWCFRHQLAVTSSATNTGFCAERPPPCLDLRSGAILGVLVATVIAYLAGTDLAWTAAAGCVAVVLLQRGAAGGLWPRIDWSILLFFAGLFICVAGLQASGAVTWCFARLPALSGADAGEWWMASIIFLVGSNIVSNVPFILVIEERMAAFANPQLAWELLAMASTFAGNLTLLGSVANIIVAEKGRDLGGMGFWAYARVGFPLALITTTLGTAWLVWVHT